METVINYFEVTPCTLIQQDGQMEVVAKRNAKFHFQQLGHKEIYFTVENSVVRVGLSMILPAQKIPMRDIIARAMHAINWNLFQSSTEGAIMQIDVFPMLEKAWGYHDGTKPLGLGEKVEESCEVEFWLPIE